jgi:two-component system, OmpR family, alkaline phosphatase synthesis response regulator PhoP
MDSRHKILVIEDEQAIAMTIRDRRASECYAVAVAPDGEEGYKLARSGGYSLVVLDLMLPEKDGVEVCRDLRARHISVPILMLTARDQIADKVVGLKMGADDYLTKPFDMSELLARVEALLRRTAPRSEAGTSYEIGPFTLDLRRQELVRDGQVTPLSTQEYKLLCYLHEHRGEVLDRDELLTAVWGYDETVYTRTVDVHIAWLRQKLDDSRRQSLIVTIRGRGYKLVDE